MLEVVQIEALVLLGLLRKGNKEANEEDGNYENEEAECPLERTSNALPNLLLSMLGRILIVFLVPEVGKGNDKQTENRIERVERVVYDSQRVDNTVNLF